MQGIGFLVNKIPSELGVAPSHKLFTTFTAYTDNTAYTANTGYIASTDHAAYTVETVLEQRGCYAFI